MKWIVARLLEPSSWAGIGVLFSVVDNLSTNGGLTQSNVGMIMAALVAILLPGKVIAPAPAEVYPSEESHKAIDNQ